MKNTHTTKTAAGSQTLAMQYDAHSAAVNLLNKRFGLDNQEEIPAIDEVLMHRLNDALVHADQVLLKACFLRGLLPSVMADSLRIAGFLSFTLPSARAAQAETGVPASLLIAESYIKSGNDFFVDHFYLPRPSSHDLFATGKDFASFKEAFMERARELCAAKWFEPVLRASAENPEQYVKQIKKWSHDKHGKELAEIIEQHSLFECDRLNNSCFV